MRFENDRSALLRVKGVATGLMFGALVAGGCSGKTSALTSPPGGPGGAHGAGGGGADGQGWPDLPQAEITFQGGDATSSGGQAHSAGSVHLVSKGVIVLDSALPQPAPPATGSPSGDAVAVKSAALGADVSEGGSVTISGTVTGGGSDAVRRITAGGDIFIDGTLRTADLSGTRQGLTLEAPNGTVAITGSIDTSGAAGTGQGGGPLTITARQVVVSGKLLTLGANGATAGDGGAITITTTEGVLSSGVMDASGGNAKGKSAVTGAHGGDLHVKAGGDVGLGGTIRVRGGAALEMAAADAKGGDAGSIVIDGGGALTCAGIIDARGGFATASARGGAVAGGAGGSWKVGEAVQPSAISVLVPVFAVGGNGAAAGGLGGDVLLEPHGGDLRIAADLDTTGGSSANPGAGGTITVSPGPENATAGIDISGRTIANGGSVPSGGSGNGAPGGVIKLVPLSRTGNLTIEPGGQVQTDGGSSGGSGTAGNAGVAYLFTIDGNLSLHGNVFARGGAAPDPGGTGGDGGLVYLFTGNGHDRLSGVLTIESDGVIDASGGAGTIGGSARNDGRASSVATFPARQDDEWAIDQIAVLINSDGVHGFDHGWIDNQGQVVARGGNSNGNGGDVVYHGKRQDGNETPLPGTIINSGDGSGHGGDFAGE